MIFTFENYIVPIPEFVLTENSITINKQTFSNKNEVDSIRREILNSIDKGLVDLKKANAPEFVKVLCSEMRDSYGIHF